MEAVAEMLLGADPGRGIGVLIVEHRAVLIGQGVTEMGIVAGAAAADQFHLAADDDRLGQGGRDRIAEGAADGGPSGGNGAVAEGGITVKIGGIVLDRPGRALGGLAPLADVEGLPWGFRNGDGLAHVDLNGVEIDLGGFRVLVEAKADAVELGGHLGGVDGGAAVPVLVLLLDHVPAHFVVAVGQGLDRDGEIVDPGLHDGVTRSLLGRRDRQTVVAPGAAPAAVLDGPDHAGAAVAIGHGAGAGAGMEAVAEMLLGADPGRGIGLLILQGGAVLVGQGVTEMGIVAGAAAADKFKLAIDHHCLFGGRFHGFTELAADGGPTGRDGIIAHTGITIGSGRGIEDRPGCTLGGFAPILHDRDIHHPDDGKIIDVDRRGGRFIAGFEQDLHADALQRRRDIIGHLARDRRPGIAGDIRTVDPDAVPRPAGAGLPEELHAIDHSLICCGHPDLEADLIALLEILVGVILQIDLQAGSRLDQLDGLGSAGGLFGAQRNGRFFAAAHPRAQRGLKIPRLDGFGNLRLKRDGA